MAFVEECITSDPCTESKLPLALRHDDLDLKPQPSYPEYVRRRNFLATTKPNIYANQLPLGFPPKVRSEDAWSGLEVSYEDFIYVFSKNELEEVESALASFKVSGVTINEIAPENFTLPSLGPKLRSLSDQVYTGRGVIAFRGLDPASYSTFENAAIFAGIASYIAEQRGFQNIYNDHLMHIYKPNEACPRDAPDMIVRPVFSSNTLPFHNDSCEVLALFCIEPASSGGRGFLASASRVYNDLVSTRPETISILAQEDWPFENRRSSGSVQHRPVLYSDRDRPFFYASRFNLCGSTQQRRPECLPRVTLAQADAIDALEFTAAQHAMKVPYKKGDMLFFNNFAVLHSRENFQCADNFTHRHLLRLWLRDGRFPFQIPEALKWKWRDVYDRPPDRKPRWNLDKERDCMFLYQFKHLINDEGEQGSQG